MRLRTIEGINKGVVIIYFDGNASKTEILTGKVTPNSYSVQDICADAQRTQLNDQRRVYPWVIIRFITDGISVQKRPGSSVEFIPNLGIITKATTQNFCTDFALYKNGKEITFSELTYDSNFIPKNLTQITPKFDSESKVVGGSFDKKYLYFGAVGLALLYFFTRKK